MPTEIKLKIFKKNIIKPRKLLLKKLRTYNVSKINRYPKKQIFLGYHKGKSMIAGLYASLALGVFYIDLLWIDQNYRNQKLGTNLLKIAEDYARKNKALYIRLNSGSFQAPKFYLKNGYKQFAKLPLITNTKQKLYDHYFIKYLR